MQGEHHLEALTELLRWRRDVRHFRTDPVPEALLDRLRATMELAPSVGNSRPWRVIRVEAPDLRAAVRADHARCRAAAGAAYDPQSRAAYDRLKLAGLDAAPVQLAVFTEADPPEGRGLGRHTMPGALEQSTAMAVHTLWLAARAQGLGLGMVTILDPARIEALFAVPAGWRFSAYLCIGWPESQDDRPLLHRLDWQADTPTRWQTR